MDYKTYFTNYKLVCYIYNFILVQSSKVVIMFVVARGPDYEEDGGSVEGDGCQKI